MPHSASLTSAGLTPYCDELSFPCLLNDSWQRSQRYGLSRGDDATSFVSRALLEEARSQHGWLDTLARPLMQRLGESLNRLPSVVVASDDTGLVLDTFGNNQFLHKAQRVALAPGNLWGEHARGTNAIGTALALHAPCEVHGDQHFLNQNAGLYCYGVPVFRPDGQIAGVLDLSTPAQQPVPEAGRLMRQAVRQLEHDWVIAQLDARQWLLRLHADPAALGSAQELLLAFRDNCLVAANKLAMEEFNLSTAHIGTLSLDALFPQALPADDGAALTASNQRRYHARSQLPARRVWAARPAAPEEESGVETGKALRLLNAGIALCITGETGCGKEHLSRRLHQQSQWRDGPFVAINCAALPEQLIESELFGYQPGAFTGASSRGYIGKIREADGGVLFLDEIGDMPLSMQTRLLRVLQEKNVVPLGGTRAVPVTFTLICATHRPLDEMVAQGAFREDLFYRIEEYRLRIPPLREWPALPRFVQRLWQELGGVRRGVTLSSDLVAHLARLPWPGNVRQLASLLKVLLALADDGDVVTLSDLPHPYRQPVKEETAPPEDQAAPDVDAVLHSVNGNMSLAARKLGVSRSTLYRRLEKQRAALR
ncbi:sigma-54-dependent Fis family transcriptional regulator [Cronobacter dublinensis]|uniref:sigma-54-dependent Fis family transcriptional regulator n=1 Tax=Cronobacter dublinensis TaxID=413497 RepID=UPI000D002E7A|nr:sigma-54-dependent Fis family transcriptional regulator [Cronobacter dublinensis]